jgi:hypothetical protein
MKLIQTIGQSWQKVNIPKKYKLALIVLMIGILLMFVVQFLSYKTNTISSVKPLGVALTAQPARDDMTYTVQLVADKNYEGSSLTSRGMVFRLELSNKDKVFVDISSIKWGESFLESQGVKYAIYDPVTGYLDIALAAIADIELKPKTTILSFDIVSRHDGSFTVGFDKDFPQTDVVDQDNMSILSNDLRSIILKFPNTTN